MNKQIITRFAPSPTGFLHAGNYRSALFAYLFARQNGGKFLLRIEDTDKERSKKEYEENILESLKWLGLEHDGEVVRQSDQIETHKKYLQQLIDSGHAYISKEEAKDGSGVVKEIIRFKNPNEKVSFHDLIRGEIEMDTTDLKDFVIAKNINEPLFHLAVVVDDFTMGVTHIVRGEDHISNTPRQILIQRAIGAPTPTYAHVPLILSADRSKLSKRKGALAITAYRDLGYLPEAVINYMALLGWNPGNNQEILSREELTKLFDLTHVQKGGAIFSEEKLRWVNKEYLKKLSKEDFRAGVEHAFKKAVPEISLDAATVEKILPLILERADTFADVELMLRNGEFVYFFKKPTYETSALLWKDEKDQNKAAEHLAYAASQIEKIPENTYTYDIIKTSLWDYAEKVGRGNILWPLRFCLTGAQKSPDPFTTSEILGKKETLERIATAIDLLKQ